MRPGGHAGHPDKADDIALPDPRTLLQAAGKPAEMTVGGGVFLIMLDLDVVAVARNLAGEGNDAVPGGVDRRSNHRAEIDAAMHAAVAEDRVEAHAEAGGQSGTVDRSTQQWLADVFAHSIEKAGLTIRRRVAVEPQPRAAQDHLAVEESPDSGCFAGLIMDAFVYRAERIAGMDVTLKVDIVAESPDHFAD